MFLRRLLHQQTSGQKVQVAKSWLAAPYKNQNSFQFSKRCLRNCCQISLDSIKTHLFCVIFFPQWLSTEDSAQFLSWKSSALFFSELHFTARMMKGYGKIGQRSIYFVHQAAAQNFGHLKMKESWKSRPLSNQTWNITLLYINKTQINNLICFFWIISELTLMDIFSWCQHLICQP